MVSEEGWAGDGNIHFVAERNLFYEYGSEADRKLVIFSHIYQNKNSLMRIPGDSFTSTEATAACAVSSALTLWWISRVVEYC